MKRQYRVFAFFLLLSILGALLLGCGDPLKNKTADPDSHACQNVCPKCAACRNGFCTEKVCKSKCSCEELSDNYFYFPTLRDEMPAIRINTADGSNEWATRYSRYSKLMGLIDYTDATVSTAFCENEYLLDNVKAEVKVRGNYTLDYDKKPIRIKFKEKNNLLGLHGGEEYKNWVLLAEWKDLSMLNNTVAFYLGNTILGSDGFYCTDFCPVEVYLNGECWGVYLLVEQQEAKDGRTSVPDVPKNYTGNDIGYFFEYDAYYELERNLPDGDPTFVMDHLDVPATHRGYTIKSDINADSQVTFLQNYMNNVFFIAYQATRHGVYYKFTDDKEGVVLAPEYTSAKEAVGAVLNLQSLVDTYILNEIACDLDVDWSSFYLSLDMTASGDGKVTFEAPWDFDSSFGMINKRNFGNPVGLYAAVYENPWFRLLVGESWFEEMVREKWAEMKRYGVQDGALDLIEVQKDCYASYYVKNYNRWSSRVIFGNGEVVPVLNTYKDIDTAQGLAADYLIDWLTRRFEYLDSIWRD